MALTNSKLKKFKTSSVFAMREEKGRDKDEMTPPQPPLYDFKPDDPQSLSNELGHNKATSRRGKQATKNIEITLKPGKIRDS